MRSLLLIACILVSSPAFAACVENGIVAGVLRNDGEGWYAIDDGDHTPLNIRSVITEQNHIRITYTFEADTIYTFIATPDETLAANGVSAGASVDLSFARIFVSGEDLSRISTRTMPNSNIWVYGLFEFSCP